MFELGLGGVLLAGGGGWLGFALGERERLLDHPELRVTAARLDRTDGQRIAAALFTGVGAGLVLFSGIALLHDAADRRKRARVRDRAVGRPGLAGWSLAGRFEHRVGAGLLSAAARQQSRPSRGRARLACAASAGFRMSQETCRCAAAVAAP
ncbi:hypothetical protein [Nannocystis pusilla]|uniref:hypothetical protein n=1 Tax=Nannocystis pusilla TaxID=889268 RepID=UPI003B7BE82A